MSRPLSFRSVPALENPRRWLSRALCGALCSGAVVGAMAVASAGCLDRPVVPQSPKTTARVVKAIPHDAINKIDLLFMIDNSSSMGDKQELLAAAVPDLLSRFLTPNCVQMDGTVVQRTGGACPPTAPPEFTPIGDIHIAVISSSLGSHGADATGIAVCPDMPPKNDQAHLLTRDANGGNVITTPPFLNWNTMGLGAGAIMNQAMLQTQFAALVTGVNEAGCGYEAQLESIYRFLIDPTPPANLVISNGNVAAYGAIDTTILSERQQFLRPDSLVAVIAVTDENDCSISDVGNANLYLVSDMNGNDPYFPNTNADGSLHVMDTSMPYPNHPNLRCFHEQQRFGQDGMWSVDRYINGFTNLSGITSNIDNDPDPNKGSFTTYPNPLYTDLSCPPTALTDSAMWPPGPAGCTASKTLRADKSFVFFAGIVGVPWQDIARTNAAGAPDLAAGYMTAAEIVSNNRWGVILGDGVSPTDPFMVESRTPRQTGAADPVMFPLNAIADPMSATPTAAINGHEWSPNGDLEFACIFPIDTLTGGGKVCSATVVCDCFGGEDPAASRNPVCQTAQNTFSTTQHYAKAYPCIRELQVLQGLGEQAVVASICPANVMDTTASTYGYRPAVGAIVDKLKSKLTQQCFSRQLELKDCAAGTMAGSPTYDQVNCIIIESRRLGTGEVCSCEGDMKYPGRLNIPAEDLPAVPADINNSNYCNCEIQQLSAATMADQNTCLTNAGVTDDTLNGWCYVDPARGLGNAQIVSKCSASGMRTVRYPPRAGSTAYIACQEAAFDSAAADGGVQGCMP